jgi:tetratricopeptide (TPR) repeat protein
MMKRQLIAILVIALVAAVCVPAVMAQATGTVKGVVKDLQGKPIPGATVEYTSTDTGRKYTLKTNNKGEFLSLGVAPGTYTVTLLQDGKELYHFSRVPVTLDETQNILNFDLQKEQQNQARGQGLTPEQVKERQEQQAKAQKEQNTVKELNAKLAEANTASQAGNFDQAIQVLTEATQMDANRDLLWFKLGDAYRSSATKQTDQAEKTKRYEQAVTDYQKAIQLKEAAASQTPAKGADPDADKKTLSAYYNNLGEVFAKSGKTDDAVKAYNQSATVYPAGAAQAYFNLGAVMTNTGKVDDAVEAFKKSIAADPNKADSYYWLGVNMLGKATLKGDKMVAPEGTAEAFNKYLELQPTGQFAQPAKDMLASIGAAVETSYGKKKTAKNK